MAAREPTAAVGQSTSGPSIRKLSSDTQQLALSEDDVLERVFAYSGQAAWLQIAAICCKWTSIYRGLCIRTQTSTQYAVQTEATLRLGLEANLRDVHRHVFSANQRLKFAAYEEGCEYLLSQDKSEDVSQQALQRCLARGCTHRLTLTDLCRICCAYGTAACLEWLLHSASAEDSLPETLNVDLSVAAAQGGQVAMFDWLLQRHRLSESYPGLLTDVAAKLNRCAVVRWLYAHSYKLGTNVCKFAISNGNLELLSWLHSVGTRCTTMGPAFDAAAKGYLSILQFLYANRTGTWLPSDLGRMVQHAGAHGHIYILSWLHYDLSAPMPNRMWSIGYTYEKCWPLSSLCFAMEHGGEWGTVNVGPCSQLKEVVSPESFAWAHEHGCPCDCGTAAAMAIDDEE